MYVLFPMLLSLAKCKDLRASLGKAGDVAQLEEGLPLMQDPWVRSPHHRKPGVMATFVNPAVAWQVEAGRSYPQSHREYRASSNCETVSKKNKFLPIGCLGFYLFALFRILYLNKTSVQVLAKISQVFWLPNQRPMK